MGHELTSEGLRPDSRKVSWDYWEWQRILRNLYRIFRKLPQSWENYNVLTHNSDGMIQFTGKHSESWRKSLQQSRGEDEVEKRGEVGQGNSHWRAPPPFVSSSIWERNYSPPNFSPCSVLERTPVVIRDEVVDTPGTTARAQPTMIAEPIKPAVRSEQSRAADQRSRPPTLTRSGRHVIKPAKYNDFVCSSVVM